MKHFNKILVVALVTLLALQIGDFFTAPLTVAGWAKMEIGSRMVASEAFRAYQTGGEKAVEDLRYYPREKLGFYYSVIPVVSTVSYGGKEDQKIFSVFVSCYDNRDDAERATIGMSLYRQPFDPVFGVPDDVKVTVAPVQTKRITLATETR